MLPFDERILRLDGPVVYFPVRHHSPACARLVRDVARQVKPKAILIEGPSDFNPRFGDLYLPHRLPIAIYSYARYGADLRTGAFYPFCEYSPEWQALLIARKVGAEARFIDLPWTALDRGSERTNLYADSGERRATFFDRLTRECGVPDFDALWDHYFEIDSAIAPQRYFSEAHHLMHTARVADSITTYEDQQREAFMASQIQAARAKWGSPVLVVTGGFHSYALFARIEGVEFEAEVAAPEKAAPPVPTEAGIALTPYSYERLDALTGYNSGMPSPGFYHRVWRDREHRRQHTHRALLAEAARELREEKQSVSSADLIAAQTLAQGLAELRGHAAVWRNDLLDGITGALIKDELTRGGSHPFLTAVQQMLRGDLRGKLADGTQLPPLVEDIHRLAKLHKLQLEPKERHVQLNLLRPADLERARILHQLRIIPITGYDLRRPAHLATRDSTEAVIESWRLRWATESDSSCIEAAIYGSTVEDAARARLAEEARKQERSASLAAHLLTEACLMGFGDLARDFESQLRLLLRQDSDFNSVTAAAGQILYLYRYDDVLASSGRAPIGELLQEAWQRGLWLLDAGNVAQGREALAGMQTLLEIFERCGTKLALDREEYIGVHQRRAADPSVPELQGAASAVLWTLDELGGESLAPRLPRAADPQKLGDFLTGLFHLAREVAQRHPGLLERIDELVLEFDEEDFLVALPALRLAFSVFTPREKDHLARTLLNSRGDAGPLPQLSIPPQMAAALQTWEAGLFEDLARYGVRGGA